MSCDPLSSKTLMTWTPTRVDPDFWNENSSNPTRRVLESDLIFGSDFRVSGHNKIVVGGGWAEWATYEWEFVIQDVDWGIGYDATYFICDLPACVADTALSDPDTNNYAALSDAAGQIDANTTYHVDIGVLTGTSPSTDVQLHSVASAASSDCPFAGIELCSFENYKHWYNKSREHSAPGFNAWYYGGSYVTDNTFSPCPGSWGFTGGNVDYWCASTGNGPEPPGRVTIRPKPTYNNGFAFRTVDFDIEPGDHFSVEYVVQCLTGDPCEGRLAWAGKGGGNPTEKRGGPNFDVPNDGWYYLCRFDSEHGADNAANLSHTKLRAKLWNREPDTQLRIDAMAIYGWVGYQDWMAADDHCQRVAQG